MERRTWIKQLAVATLVGPALFELEGCTPQGIAKLESWIGVGLLDFQGIVSIINPPAGSALTAAVTIANAAWADVQAAITAYQQAPAASKATFLGKVTVVVNALMGQIANVLGLVPGAAEYTATAKAVLLLIISTLQAIATGLPTTTTTAAVRSAAITSLTLPPPAKNAKDFQGQVNQILKNGGYPPIT